MGDIFSKARYLFKFEILCLTYIIFLVSAIKYVVRTHISANPDAGAVSLRRGNSPRWKRHRC